MNFLHTVVAFLFAICVLIIFHELGHYWVARLCGVKVLRFSLGMGKVLFSRRFGADQTEWVISAFPIGGYVKMLDLREQDNAAGAAATIPAADLAREFTRQSVWKRIAIVAAGPIANFILAIFLFATIYMIGVEEPVARLRLPAAATVAYQSGIRANDRISAVNDQPIQLWSELRWELMQHALEHQPVKLTVVDPGTAQTRTLLLPLDQLSAQDLEADFLTKLGLSLALSQPQLGRIMPDSPAMRAGLLEGDLITQIDTQPIADSVQLIELVRAAPNKTLHFGVLRAGQFHDIAVTPVAVEVNGVAVGKLNVEVRSAPEMLLHQDTLWLALKKASQRTWDTATLTLKMLGKMLVGEVSLKNVTGPLTIANYAGQTAQTGLISYISFLAFISISLGVMNLLPIPVLDGGHLLYYSLEVLSGRPVSARYWEVAQRLGVAMLMLLMVLAFYNDIVRLLPA